MPRPVEIEVFRIGKQTAANGQTYNFTAKDIDKAIDAHRQSSFRIPVIISHDTQGVDDAKLSEHPELAHGILSNLRRVGKSVRGTIERGSQQLFDFIQQGRLVDRSMSWYLPGAKTSPDASSFFPRHLAMLGRSNPGCKNMEPMAETLGLSETFAAFDEDDPESIAEFSSSGDLDPMTYATTEDVNALKVQSESTQEKLGAIESSLQATNQKLVEFMDGMKGMMATKGKTKKASSETDDEDDEEEDEAPAPKRKRSTKKVDMSETENTPPATNANLQVDFKEFEALKGKAETLETENKNLKSQVAEFQSKVEELTPKQPAPPTPQELELMARLKRHEAIIALQESEVLKNEINACLSANKERITPGMQNKATVNYTDRTYDSDTAQFNEESKTHEFELVNFMQRVATGKTDRGDYEGFKHWLSTIPSAVDLSGKSIVPNGEVARNFSDPSAPTAGNFTEASIDRHNKIMAKAQEMANGQKVTPGDASYQEAMDVLITQGVIEAY